MKLHELFRQKKVVFSLEIFPPKKSQSIDTIYDTLEGLRSIHPDFISVTYGAGGNAADRSTCEISRAIKERYNIESLAHLTCVNSSRQQVLDTLKQLQEANVENILALRGDINPDVPSQTDFRYARELIETIHQNGDFSVAAACYPEGHPRAESLEDDVDHLREKVDAGASHLISQLFFDNADFYNFQELAAKKGIHVPIEAGIMPITNRKQIERMVSMCGASLPKPLAKMINRYGDDPIAIRDAGIAYATRQIIDLLANSVQGIHLYTMNNAEVALRIYESIASILECENRPEASNEYSAQ